MLFYAATNAASAVAPDLPDVRAVPLPQRPAPTAPSSASPHWSRPSLVGPAERARAISRVMLGLTVATIVGVPFATALGPASRLALRLRAGERAGTRGCGPDRGRASPPDLAVGDRSPLAELGAARPALQVWLTLAIGAVGFGGLFAVYTYLGPTLVHVTHRAPRDPAAGTRACSGSGSAVGNLVAAFLRRSRADARPSRSLLVWTGATELMFARVAADFALVLLAVFLIGGQRRASAPRSETRLMDVSAATPRPLAASLMHSAFNIANAGRPGDRAPSSSRARRRDGRPTGIEGLVLSIAGLAVWAVSRRALERASTWSDEVGTRNVPEARAGAAPISPARRGVRATARAGDRRGTASAGCVRGGRGAAASSISQRPDT